MIDLYTKAEVDAVYIAVNEFKNVMAPNLVTQKNSSGGSSGRR